MGLSLITLRTCHFPLKYVINGKIKDLVVSSPWIAQWILALLNHKIKVENMNTPLVMPYGNIVNKLDSDSYIVTNHKCLLECTKPQNIGIFMAGLDYVPKELQKSDIIWFIDGSSYYVDRVQKTGYVAIQVDTDREHEITWVVNGGCNFTSAQTAELVAIIILLLLPAWEYFLIVTGLYGLCQIGYLYGKVKVIAPQMVRQ